MADNLLDKASILLTPTAYNDGSMLSIKPENGDGDFTFSRSSAATRVNAQGLVENVQIISSELVSNGNFSQIGTEEVSNGNFSQEGSELVTNGDFSNGTTNWTFTDANGNVGFYYDRNEVCEIDFTNTSTIYASQSNVLTNGKSYKITLDYYIPSTNVSADYVQVRLGTTSSTSALTPNLDVLDNWTTITLYGVSNGSDIYIYTPSGTIGDKFYIDNVSVKEVGQDWIIENTWTIGDGVANGNGANGSGEELISNSSSLPIGTYKIVFEIKDYVSGGVIPYLLGATETFSSNGVHTVYKTITSASGLKFRGSNFTGSITNISVKEVGQDWTSPDYNSALSIVGGQLKIESTVSLGRVAQAVTTVVGKTYLASANITNIDSSTGIQLKLSNGYNLDGAFFTSSFNTTTNIVTIKHYFVATATTTYIGTSQGSSAGQSGLLGNVSVKEITDDTDLPRINYEGFSYQDSLGSEEVVNGDFATDTNWTKASNWTISGGSANSNGSGLIYQTSVSYVDGKTYKVTFDANITSGGGTVRLGNTTSAIAFTNGANEFYLQTDASNTTRYIFFQGNSLVGSIDNVSVKEVLGQEVVPNSGCGSWLLEPQSTNLITYSEDFSQWNSDKTTPTLNSATSPSGDVNSAKLTSTGVYGSLNLTISKSSSALNYTQSVFIKAVNYSIVNLISYGSSSANRAQVSFDLSDGSVSTAASVNGAYSNPSESIQDYGNGWYRISLSFTSDTSVEVRPHIQFPVQMTNDDYVLLWGAMLENQSFSTSYVPTSGATNTRLQDIATNSGNSTLINSTEGVLYAEIAALVEVDAQRRFITLNNGTSLNGVVLRYEATGVINARYQIGGYAEASFNYTTTITDTHKVAFKWKENDFALWVDGVEVGTDNNGNVLGANIINNIDFNSGNGTFPFYGKNKALAVYKEALTDAQLQSLTTQ